MRAVAKKAGVNLGMFHYHFKSKEVFIARVAAELYEQFFRTFTLEAETGRDPKERLQNAIKSLVRFARDNRRMILAMVRDVLDGNQQLVRLLEALIPRHGIILLRLLRECQKQGYISKMPIPVVVTHLFGGMAAPVFMAALLEQIQLRQPYDFLKKFAVPFILSDRVMEQRLDFVFQGMDPRVTRDLEDEKWEKQIDQFIKALEAEQQALQSKITKKQTQAPQIKKRLRSVR
jgi:AcrR family transcriptional regulator